MNKGGRPAGSIKLTDEIQETIVKCLRAGSSIETASEMAGISRANLYNWLKRGKILSNKKERSFLDAVKKAQAECEVRLISSINKAGDSNWQAHAWLLERKYPEKWAKKDKIEHSGKIEGEKAIEIKVKYVKENEEG